MDDRPGDLLGLPEWFTHGVGRCSGRIASFAGLHMFWFS
jgi:hypothetical protein